ncbi:hypothetical protein HanRHA438_Chr00c14g0850061 [Helianthus annuus]|nr:hypothetical protein HanIR_Chr17g0879831 [Helianthus annuus]KAJ0954521.1 hypothetical protein HanRHA438_Chr00c14g0850061 [Helianthus annuus]
MRRHHLIQPSEHPSADKNRRKLHTPIIFTVVFRSDRLKLLRNIVLFVFFKLKDARIYTMTVQQPLHYVTHTASTPRQHDHGVF